jgi:glycosyltransferase involved in cell wall biosynthesis
MYNNNIDYFKYQNNFIKNEQVESILISGKISLPHPKVSILIPTYKREDLLKETIESALNQIFFSDYNIIIIDNNPERNCKTEQLIKDINTEKILYFKNSINLGMFGNWNRGFELSKSEWTVLLHDDDIISPYFLNTCSKFFNYNDVALIKPKVKIFSKISQLNFLEPTVTKAYRYYLSDFIYGCSIGAPTCILYKTSKLISSGGFDQNYFPCGDYVSSSILAKQYKIYKLNCVLGGYRISNNESLNEKTMNLYHYHRFYVSTFIMRYFNFPSFLIYILQASWIQRLIKAINSLYNIKINYDYESNLHLKKVSSLVSWFVFILIRIVMEVINLFRPSLKTN